MATAAEKARADVKAEIAKRNATAKRIKDGDASASKNRGGGGADHRAAARKKIAVAKKKANKPADKPGGKWKWVKAASDWVFSKVHQATKASPNATRTRNVREAEEAANK